MSDVTLADLIDGARDGKVYHEGAAAAAGQIVENQIALPFTSRAITAEAFRLGLFDPDVTTWDNAERTVAELM